MGLSSEGSEEVVRLDPFARGMLEEIFVLSGGKPEGVPVRIEFLLELVGGERSGFDKTVNLLEEMGLVAVRRKKKRTGIILTAKGDVFLRDYFVEEEDKAVYRALKKYIDIVVFNPFFSLKLARLVRRTLVEHTRIRIDLHVIEGQLMGFLRSRKRDESNEWFLHLAEKVVKSEPSPVMKRCLGTIVDNLFDVAYAASFLENRVRPIYLLLSRWYLRLVGVLAGLWMPAFALIALVDRWPIAGLLFQFLALGVAVVILLTGIRYLLHQVAAIRAARANQ